MDPAVYNVRIVLVTMLYDRCDAIERFSRKKEFELSEMLFC